LIQQFDRLGPEERRDLLLNFVRREAVAVLGLNDGESVPIDRGLFEMGMDSLMSVELRRRLERGIGQSLPSTLTFNYPNIAALATFIEGVLRKAGPQETAPKLTDGIVSDGESLSKMTDAELEARMAALLEKVR
jgi:acyl carrier protein